MISTFLNSILHLVFGYCYFYPFPPPLIQDGNSKKLKESCDTSFFIVSCDAEFDDELDNF